MFNLSTRRRCGACDVPLPAEATAHCPSCRADLAAVGAESEMSEWGRTRLVGRAAYLRGWMVRFGLIGLLHCVGHAYRGRTDPNDYVDAAIWPVSGFLAGLWVWRSSERSYAARRAEPLADPTPENPTPN